MARVKRAVNAHKKRRTILDRASGYRGQRSRLYRKAKEQAPTRSYTVTTTVVRRRAISVASGFSVLTLHPVHRG